MKNQIRGTTSVYRVFTKPVLSGTANMRYPRTVTGTPVASYYKCSEQSSRDEFAALSLLPCTKRQLSERGGAVTGSRSTPL